MADFDIHDVPDKTIEILAARAARAEKSLSDYVRDLFIRHAETPSVAELTEDLTRRDRDSE